LFATLRLRAVFSPTSAVRSLKASSVATLVSEDLNMKDLDPGRSGREDYNPETEGKPADRDRSTGNNPEGMQGSQSDRDRSKGMQGSHSDRDHNKGMKGQQSDRDRGGNVREPDRGAPADPSRARPGSTDDELNDEDSALESGKSNRGVDEDFEEPDRDR
jgi:hypothetical protein